MAVELATAYVAVVPSMRGFGKTMARDLNREVGSAGEDAGAALGGGVKKGASRLMKAGALGAIALSAFTVKKGLDRALGIENAEAKLKGLGHSAKSVAGIMDNALAAVKGTAFGLDEAATTAATAVAAGVKPGKALTKYLKTTADAATIAGVSMGDMGKSMNKVTTIGAAFNDSLQIFAEKGLPVYSWLSDELKVSTAEVKELASKGKISAETFNKVVRKNIGGAALASGKTTTGAFKNVMAAVGRLGEQLVAGVLPKIRGGFNGLIGTIDNFGPAAARIGTAIGDAASGLTRWVQNSKGVASAVSGLRALVVALWGSFRDLWEQITTGNLGVFQKALDGVLTAVGKVTTVLAENADAVRNLVLAYAGFKFAALIVGLTKSTVAWIKNTIAILANAKATVASKLETAALYALYGADAVRRVAASTGAWIANTASLAANKVAAVALKAVWSVQWMMGQLGVVIRSTAAWVANTAALIANKVAELALAVASKAVVAGQMAMAAAQRVLNMALAANPIGLIITAVIALGAALVLAYKKSETFRKIVQGAWMGIQAAASYAWNRVLKPALAALWGFIQKRLIPVFKLYWRVVSMVWTSVARVVRWGWSNVVLPVFRALQKWLSILALAFRTTKDVVSRIWSAIGTGVSLVYTRVIRPVFSKLGDGLAAIRTAFQTTRDFIARAWGGLKALIAKPIEAAIGVINSVLIRPINAVADKLIGKKPLKEIAVKGFSDGGYTGRAPRDRVAGVVHGDEYVTRSWARRRLESARPGALDWMNTTGQWPGYAKGGRVRRVMPLANSTMSTYPGHTGVDLNSPNDYGKPVLAAAPGVVSAVKRLTTSYGQHVWVRMAGGMEAIYAHLSKISVKAGQTLAAGQQVGNVGSTGNSTGPHLHFEIRPGGTYAASKAFLQGAQSFAGAGASATGEADGGNFISRIVNARKALTKRLGSGGGVVGDLIRGSAAKLGSAAITWVKNKVGDVFGAIGRGVSSVFGSDDGPSDSKTVSTAKGAAQSALKGYGWSNIMWGPLDRLWEKESGWRWNAQNPTSSAYGIPQALPGSKMASAGRDWKTNPLTQIKWGLGYIKDRYGSPAQAWAHSQRVGWYDRGGWLMPTGRGGKGTNVGVNKTRKPEPVLTATQWALLKRFLPLKRAREKVTDLRTVERIVARVARKYGDTSNKAARARRVALDAKFELTGKQWKQFRKALPGYTKKAGRPESLRDMQKLLARTRREYGRRSPEYRRAAQATARARYGGQYTKATFQQLKKLIPGTGRLGTANTAARQIQSLVTKVFGPNSRITRQVTRLATRVQKTTTNLTGLNARLKDTLQAQSEFAGQVRDNFRADAFGNGLANLRLTLQANTNDAKAFGAALRKASAKGLSGGLLKALAASGDTQTAKEISNLSAKQIAALERQWAAREKATSRIGAQAAQMVYGGDVRALRRSISHQSRILRTLRSDIREATYAGTKAGIQGTTRRAKSKKKTKGKR